MAQQQEPWAGYRAGLPAPPPPPRRQSRAGWVALAIALLTSFVSVGTLVGPGGRRGWRDRDERLAPARRARHAGRRDDGDGRRRLGRRHRNVGRAALVRWAPAARRRDGDGPDLRR